MARIFPLTSFLLSLSIFWLGFFSAASASITSNGPSSIFQEPSSKHRASEVVPIRVMFNWNHQFQYAGFYAAQMQGFYQDANLAVQLKDWNRMSHVDNIEKGVADVGVGYSLLLADYIKGRPIKLLFSVFQYSPFVLISHEPINQLEELKGRRIMFSESYEFLSMLNKSGLPTEDITLVPTNAELQEFIDGNVDVYTAYETNELFRLNRMGVPFHILDPKYYGVVSYGDLAFTSNEFAQKHPAALERFKAATIKGWRYALDHPEEVVDFIMQNYAVKKSREAMLDEARRTTKYVETNSVPIGDLNLAKLNSMAEQMQSVGLFSEQQRLEADLQNVLFSSRQLFLTKEERAYIKANPVVRIGNDVDWAPFEYIDEQENYRGIAADYMKLIERRLGIEFEFFIDTPWYEVMDRAKSGDIDMLSCAVSNDRRQRYMNFTDPYLSFPMVLLARDHVNYVDDFSKLKGKTVAVVQNYATHDYLQKHYPEIPLLKVRNLQEGMEAVLEGRAFAYSGNIAAINYGLKKFGIDGLKIVGQSKQRFELSIGVQKDNEILFSIMQKALNSITEDEEVQIYDNWFNLRVVTEVDNAKLFVIVGWAALIILVLLALLFYFYRARVQHKKYINQINELTCATVSDSEQRFVWVSHSFCVLTGYSREELIGQKEKMLYAPSVAKECQETLKKAASNLETWVGELKGYTKVGDVFWVKETRIPEQHSNSVIRVVTTREIITSNKRLQELAIIDELTGLYNRRYFNEAFPREIKRTKREGKTLAVASIDIDFFKLVNDTYGHQAGDDVLRKISEVLKAHFNRAGDFIFRMGGEEFLVSTHFDSEKEFTDYLDKLREYVEYLNIENIHTDRGVVTLSIGAGIFDLEDINSPEQIYSRVDKAMYLVKNHGRNHVRMVEPE